MNSASLRAGTTAATRGHRSSDSFFAMSSSNARTCQNAPRKKVSTTQISKEMVASIRANKFTPIGSTAPTRPPLCNLRHSLRLYRQSPHRLPRRGENHIAHRRRNRRRPRLSDPARPVVALHDVHFHLWRLVHPHHVVIIEVRLLHAAVGDRNLAFQRRRQSVNNSALNLRANRLRIHMPAAIDRRYHAMHLHRMRLAINTDFRHFCHVAPKRFHHRDAPVAPRSHWFAPSRLFRRQFQHSALPHILAQQPAPEFKRIFPRGLGHFFHETLRDVPIVRISHRPPESHWHSRLRQQILHQKIRHVIFQRRDAFRRRIIQAVLYRPGEKPRHDRRAHNARLPRHRRALVVQPRPQFHPPPRGRYYWCCIPLPPAPPPSRGAPAAFESSTASMIKSDSARRPNPPPRYVVCTRTCSGFNPVIFAPLICANV